MDFFRIEKDKLLLSIPLSGNCKKCGKLLVSYYNSGDIPAYLRHKVAGANVVIESYAESGICCGCVKEGGFYKRCDCCNEPMEFPKDFLYKLINYPDYPEGEVEHTFICVKCVSDNPQRVIKLLAKSDETEEIKNN